MHALNVVFELCVVCACACHEVVFILGFCSRGGKRLVPKLKGEEGGDKDSLAPPPMK